MTARDGIMLVVGAVMGYCFCFTFEIWRMTRYQEPPELPEPPAHHRAERDPADWWKECQ